MTVFAHTPARRATVFVAALISSAVVTSTTFAQTPSAPGPPPTWTGTAGAGMAITAGNSDTMNYNLGFDLTRTPEGRNVMKMTGLYLRGDQNDVVVVNRTSLGFRDEYTLSGRTFVFGQIDYLRDTFKLIDYLVAPTTGIGYKIIDTEPTKFAIDGGVGGIAEKNPDRDVRTSAALTASEKLQIRLTPTALLKHATTGLWKADDLEDGLYTFSIGLATQISQRVQLSVDLLDSFKNKPPTPETKKNDVALVTAITMKF
jgi:putative salt-induced outer membrane protein YdiY